VSGSFKEENELRRLMSVIFLCAVLAFLAYPETALAGKIKGTVKVKGLRTPADIVVYLTKAPAADVDLSSLQYFINYNTPDYYINTSPTITYNWEADSDDAWTIPSGPATRVTRSGFEEVISHRSIRG